MIEACISNPEAQAGEFLLKKIRAGPGFRMPTRVFLILAEIIILARIKIKFEELKCTISAPFLYLIWPKSCVSAFF